MIDEKKLMEETLISLWRRLYSDELFIEECKSEIELLNKALDKACHKLWIAEGMLFKEHSKTKEQWKEWCIKDE